MYKTVQTTGNQLLHHDHPLAEKIWDVKQAAFISQDELLARLIKSKFLLLGETHDNIRHHQHQAEIIAAFSNAKQRASIHFEMLDDKQFKHSELGEVQSLEELLDKLDETDSGWNYRQMYRVVFQQVFQAGYEFWPANLNYDTIRKIVKQGDKNIPENIKDLLKEVELSEQQNQELEQEVMKGHCGALPGKMISPMMLAQRVRDAQLSLSMLNSQSSHMILIAGSGHVRIDRAVPLYLSVKDPQADIISLAFIEVMAEKYSMHEYAEQWGQDTMPFDYVWMTPRTDRVDPCEQFIEMMSKKS